MSATQARLGLIIGGTVIGAFFGVPGLGLAIGGLAGQLLIKGPDQPQALGPRLGDMQVQVSAYGNPIPIIFGTERAAGNIIWNSKIREIAHESSSGGGGKGGSPQPQGVTTFEYRVDLQIALCKGPIAGLKRLWANDQLYYDFENPPHAKGIKGKLYIGDDVQLPDPIIEADKGIGNVSAHRGLAHFVFRDISLTPFQNAIPTFHFEVISQGGAPVAVQEIIDDPTGGADGYIQIDPDTGFFWASRVLTHKVDVFSCDGTLTKICSIDHQAPFFLSHQPAFSAVNVDILGTVSNQLVIPRMWVGSHFPDSNPGAKLSAYAVDGSCRELETIQDPLGGSAFCWPGFVFVDLTSINLTQPNFGDGPYLISAVTNGACSFFASYGLGPFGEPLGLGIDPHINNIGVLAELTHVADAVQGDNRFYVIDRDGFLWQGRYAGMSGGFTVNVKVRATTSFGNLNNSVTYDPEEEAVYTKSNVFGGNIFIKKWTRDLVEVWSFEVGGTPDFFDPRRIRYHKSVGDVWVVGKDISGFNKAKRINKQDGGILEEFTLDSSRTLSDFQPFPGAPFGVGVFFSFPGGVIKFPLGKTATLDPPTLGFVVSELVKASDTLTDADIDVTSLDPFLVRGYAIASRMPVRNALQALMTAYFFDAVESDDKIKFIRRGTAPVITVPPEDMAARRDESGPVEPVQEDRTQENELPRQLDTRFINFNTDYKIGTTTTRRLIGESEQIRTFDIPIVFTPTEAKLVNDVVIHNAWFERTPKSFALGRKYLRLDPTDVITITTQDQGQIDVRINQISTSLPQLMQIEANEEDSTVYEGFEFPAPEGLQPQPGLLDTPPTILIIMDIPTLRDVDNNTGVYLASYALGGPFRFAQVFHSLDNIAFGTSAALSNEAGVGFANSKLTWEGSFS